MKVIQKSGWYHLSKERINHYFFREKNISICGLLGNKKYLNGIDLTRYSKEFLQKILCSVCVSMHQKNVQNDIIVGDAITCYTKTSCPDCDADCVIISNSSKLKNKVHIHVGCPAND